MKPGRKTMKGFLGFGKNQNQKQNDPENNIHFELCGCKSEVLVLEYDKEIGLMDLCIYEIGVSYRNKMSWRQKIRYIWQVLIHDTPYRDQIVLDVNQLKKLSKFINSVS